MDFRIADTFTDSLANLTGEEQKAVKTTAFDLQVDPSRPGLSFHALDRAKDPRFCSVRVSKDLRLIVHKMPESLLLCFVDHHNKAYDWAERRKLEVHPTTGAAQIVEVRERVEERIVPRYVERPVLKPPLFGRFSDEDLLSFGVPPEWLEAVRQADEDSILVLAEHLPGEAADALLELAVGGTPRPKVPPEPVNPFDHPDAQRRFRIVSDVEELARALDYPWEKWTIFLHPAQRELVERRFKGPARVSGSAGTGKSIVAIHRAACLARTNPDARLLLTTFSDPLASALRGKLSCLIGKEPRVGERIEVDALETVARRLYERSLGPVEVASREEVRRRIEEAAAESPGLPYSLGFLASEWQEIVDAWGLDSWEAYRDVPRLGRKKQLPEKQRQTLWGVFDRVRRSLQESGAVTPAGLYRRLAERFAVESPPYDFVVVDEAQDVSVPQLRFLASLGGGRPDGLFFAGDLGQRIFQMPFSWKRLGVDIRGRSGTLRVNYRTSHQIRGKSDRLLGKEVADVDGNVEDRSDTVSVFNGPPPTIETFGTPEEEIKSVGRWLAARAAEGVRPEEIGVFVRSAAEVARASAAVEAAGLAPTVLDERVKRVRDRVSVGTMHLSKGLEFRSVAVMACDDEVLPSQERIEAITDETDLEEVYNTERHLLYVACTRARDHLSVTGVDPASEFLQDLDA
ncbi:MAG TPA: 3'-5' exonuclease [Armatimonadota bacterium]|jgi:superfamily I DNA/RNA helicase